MLIQDFINEITEKLKWNESLKKTSFFLSFRLYKEHKEMRALFQDLIQRFA